jgi:AcrR family transcriptional regulator
MAIPPIPQTGLYSVAVPTATTGETARGGARERILDAAAELFYREGIRAVGVDMVVDRAGVAKASLYHHFRTKDDLAAAVLRRRDERWRRWLLDPVEASGTNPEKRVLAVFDALRTWFASDEFRGCGFINAAAEFPDRDHPARIAAREHKLAVLADLVKLVEQIGVRDPKKLARRLFLLMEGAMATAYVEGATWPATDAKAAAEVLLRDARRASRDRRGAASR